MEYQGVLKKMLTSNSEIVQYYLDLENDFLNINQLLNRFLEIAFLKYECMNCHLGKQIYRQGFCKSCFFEIPSTGTWIMRPELSRAHLGEEDRDLAYEKSVQLQPHIVYLANSSHVKVGVTRKQQVPTRWIDQGAREAIEIAEVPNRYLAGITEIALKKHVADKTNWRKMLRNDIEVADLRVWQAKLRPYVPTEVQQFLIENNVETSFNFPVYQYPKKPKSLNIVKEQLYIGKLVGVKGQYLIFEDQTVFNVRSNEGIVVRIKITKNHE